MFWNLIFKNLNEVNKDKKWKFMVMVAPKLLHRSENWVSTQKYLHEIQSAEMKFLKIVKTLDIGKNKEWSN